MTVIAPYAAEKLPPQDFIKFARSNVKEFTKKIIIGRTVKKNLNTAEIIIGKQRRENKMKIIEPSAELMRDFDGAEVMKFLETCGRAAYQSQNKITDDSAEKFLRNIIKRGHESVLEHFSATFKIICDRGVMAELTRHRLASFTVESTRFCDYSKGELTFIKPCFWADINSARLLTKWQIKMSDIERLYMNFRNRGVPPEQARAILPNSLKTEIIMTANLREWRHILKLRTAKDAHPQMRQVANMILDILKQKLPVIFEDIGA